MVFKRIYFTIKLIQTHVNRIKLHDNIITQTPLRNGKGIQLPENTAKLFEEIIGDKFEINVSKNKTNSHNNVHMEDTLSVTLIPK